MDEKSTLLALPSVEDDTEDPVLARMKKGMKQLFLPSGAILLPLCLKAAALTRKDAVLWTLYTGAGSGCCSGLSGQKASRVCGGRNLT